MKDTVSICFTAAQLEFLKQVLNNDELRVSVKLAVIAGEVHTLIDNAKINAG